MTTENSWVEIDLGRIVNNYRICSSLAPGKRIMAVVKANAYGHGDVEVAAALESAGCTFFAVANPSEALRLRKGGIRGDILILGFSTPDAVPDLIENNIIQTIVSAEHAEMMKRQGLRVHFAVDTGMNRIGLDGEDTDECERIIRAYSDIFRVEGIFTHLCVADTPSEDAFTRRQGELFYRLAERLSDMRLPSVHCLNSAGIMRFPESDRGSVARLGIALYGYSPDPSLPLPDGILPALEWKTRVSMVKTLTPGETVGYGRAYKAESPVRVATLTAGYADGYNRALSGGRGCVVINGRRAPVIGRVCMDQTMVDVTGIDGVEPMTEATLLGSGFDAEEMASITGTISYEELCAISSRVKRKHKGSIADERLLK